MSTSAHGFVEWTEKFVSREKGKKAVEYYLTDTRGDSVLAVVGKERSPRHMVYVVTNEFLQDFGSLNTSINPSCKWKAKRDLVDWLNFLLLKEHQPTRQGFDTAGVYLPDHLGHLERKLKNCHENIEWLDDVSTCAPKHHEAFRNNENRISVHSFVSVMSEEDYHYLAYVVDMYEDKKGYKKVQVRWFQNYKEVEAVIPVQGLMDKEIFFTDIIQVISAECVDGPVTVLTPEHYDKYLESFPNSSSASTYQCYRLIGRNIIKPFDLRKLSGYLKQAIISCLEEGTRKHGKKKLDSQGKPSMGNQSTLGTSGCRSHTPGELTENNLSLMALQLAPSFKVGQKIELLCQDSGIRGCWFRCTVLKVHQNKLKVLYNDVMDAVDGTGNLKEWVPIREAATDKLGMRCSGRLTTRPWPVRTGLVLGGFGTGTPVDAWYGDRWWEGVITKIGKQKDDNLTVYFPGENKFLGFQQKDLRVSQDWVGNQWVEIAAKPDIISAISALLRAGTKFSRSLKIAEGTEPGRSGVKP